MTLTPWRWFLVIALLLVVLSLLVWVRGVVHHHGDEVGSDGALPVAAARL